MNFVSRKDDNTRTLPFVRWLPITWSPSLCPNHCLRTICQPARTVGSLTDSRRCRTHPCDCLWTAVRRRATDCDVLQDTGCPEHCVEYPEQWVHHTACPEHCAVCDAPMAPSRLHTRPSRTPSHRPARSWFRHDWDTGRHCDKWSIIQVVQCNETTCTGRHCDKLQSTTYSRGQFGRPP